MCYMAAMRDPFAPPPDDPRRQFRDLEATLLRCPRCADAVPVRKRLLLVLPEGDKFEYVCVRCSATCGTKIERPPPLALRL
jgi:DNA-directed RNA polymerase subunit RPC12/RpoP